MALDRFVTGVLVSALPLLSPVSAQPAAVGAQAQERPAQRSCPVAEDAEYAYTREQPVQVGGSPMYGAARQRRYLDGLRGPEGQPVRYRRLGQNQSADGTILDAYEVTYEGLEKPLTLYLDWYHFNPQKAPRGLTCVGFNLGPPPVDPFRESEDLAAVALEQGRTREFEPIPIAGDDGTGYGEVYDRFRLLALAAREAAAVNRPLAAEGLPKILARFGMVLVAHPRRCGDRVVNPSAILVMAPNGAATPNAVVLDDPRALAAFLPGVTVPPGSVGLGGSLIHPRGGDMIRITSAEPCGAEGTDVTVRVTFTPARGVEMPRGTLPEGARTNEPVLLQALIDHDGHFQRASYVGGPPALAAAAIEAARRWRAEPARVNGAPVVSSTLLEIRFEPAR